MTENEEVYQLLLSLRSHGWTRDNSKNFSMKKYQNSYEDYCFVLPGYNLRPNNIYAAVGLKQLKKLNNLIRTRKKS